MQNTLEILTAQVEQANGHAYNVQWNKIPALPYAEVIAACETLGLDWETSYPIVDEADMTVIGCVDGNYPHEFDGGNWRIVDSLYAVCAPAVAVSTETAREFAETIERVGSAYLALNDDGAAYVIGGEPNGARKSVQAWTREELTQFFAECDGEPTDADYTSFAEYLREQTTQVIAN